MGSQSLNKAWLNYEVTAKEEEEQVFSYLNELPPLDFSGASPLHWQYDQGIESALPLMDTFPITPLFNSSLDLIPYPTLFQEGLLGDYGDGFGVWNYEMSTGGFEVEEKPLLLGGNNTNYNDSKCDSTVMEAKRKVEKCRVERNMLLCRESVSQYFYMPITQAAKELNVGLTLFKRRCRELGISRWPHRKLMSLHNLIHNVQEMEKQELGEGEEGKLREAIEVLERERNLIEEVPDRQLEERVKRLRQTCFKANYKKRKLMKISQSSSSSNHGVAPYTIQVHGTREDDEEIKSLLSDCSSSSSIMF